VRSIREKIILGLLRGLSLMVFLLFGLILAVIFGRGASAFDPGMLLPGGALCAAFAGTAELVLLTLLLALPAGVATGIYIVCYAPPRLRRPLDFLFDLLASMPSILIGLFGFSLILLLHRWFDRALPSLLPAAASLALLVLPYLVKATRLGLEETDPRLVTLAYGLGASREQVLWNVMLPAAAGQILKGALLSAGRAMEDTAVIMLTGAVASYGLPHSVFEPFEALPFYIYTTAAQYAAPEELETIFTASALLILAAALLTAPLRIAYSRSLSRA